MSVTKVGEDSFRIQPYGIIANSIDPKNAFRHGSLVFVDPSKSFVVCVGGRTLYELRVLSQAKTMPELAKAAVNFACEMFPADGYSPFATEAKRQEFIDSVSIAEVYGSLFAGDDLLLANPNGRAFGFMTVKIPEERTVATAIDQFYSGVPKQGESKVKNAITKAKTQVVQYLESKGIPITNRMAHHLVFRYIQDDWQFGWDNFASSGTLDGTPYLRAASTVVGDRSISRVIPCWRKGGGSSAYTPVAVENIDGYAKALEWSIIRAIPPNGSGHEPHANGLFLRSVFGHDLHTFFGGLIGKHVDAGGAYSHPGGDLTLDMFHTHCSYMRNLVLDGEVIPQKPNETAADYEARLRASEAIIEKRQTNVVATAAQWMTFSHANLIEICDRALIGGELFQGRADPLMGATSHAEVGTPFDTNQMGHTFSKSY